MKNKTTAKDRMDPSIGRRLKSARETKGITQKQMAEVLGMTTNAYQNYEYGSEMSSGRIIQICAVLECSPNWLLGVNDEPMSIPPDSALLRELRELFDELSTEGQREALRRVRELTRLDEYRKAAPGIGPSPTLQGTA
jgi:transcriptional regulator with XRE-family HTH domain